HVLRQHALDDLFAHVAISEELGITKPHPEMFLSVVRQAGSTPSGTLMVGNNYMRDIDGAHACGLATVWFRWNERYPAPRFPRAAAYVATTSDEVNAAIALWLRSHAFR
ncbi:MAG: HAD family hydrolase, partial [Chloroflexi bacterium]|nr:HAD family hydrolase [Chloroflexota bacterium]